MGSRFTVLLAAVGVVAAVVAGPLAGADSLIDLDESFGTAGIALDETNHLGGLVVPASDGSMFVVGRAGDSIAVYRIDSGGALIPSFGDEGQVVIDFRTQYEWVSDATLDSQGRLVMAGQGFKPSPIPGLLGRYIWLAIRLNPDGSLDESFGSGGITEVFDGSTYDRVASVGVDSEGRVVVGAFYGAAYYPNLTVARLSPSGLLDESFGDGGVFIHPQEAYFNRGGIILDSADRVLGAMSIVTDVENSPWGPIVINGTGVFRLDENGAIDTGFGSDGLGVLELPGSDSVEGMAIDDNDRFLVLEEANDLYGSGRFIHVSRWLTDGALDSSFGDGGVFSLHSEQLGERDNVRTFDMVAYPGNRVVVMGTWNTPDYPITETDLLLLRLTEHGELDTTFSGEGVVRTDPIAGGGQSSVDAAGLAVDRDGRVVASFFADLTPDPQNDPNTWTSYSGMARYLAVSDGPIEPIGDTNPPDDPTPPDDPSPSDDSGTFWDDDGSTFEADIEWLAARGITRGCNPPINDMFCPYHHVTRGQMAAFLARALGLIDRLDNPFMDDDTSIFQADIEKLAAAGITRGCNPPLNDQFCPDQRVTREQMAAFLVRALGLTDRLANPFVDDDTSIFQADIEKLAAAGITRGCNPPTNDLFCPKSYVTRGQMAAFLHRALG